MNGNRVGEPVADEVFRIAFTASNVYFIGEPGGPWIVVDSGLPGHFEAIKAVAEERFGRDARPEAIVLTHAHIDQYGSALALAAYWDVPIYAHRFELPYLTGRASMPPPDPTVGGVFAFVTRFLPPSETDLGRFVQALPEDHSIPGVLGWSWVHTPGHTPGHISLFREADRTLIAGDAILTVDLDDMRALLTKEQRLSRPPSPATYDWLSVRKSLQVLAALKPFVIASGHGIPMRGPNLAAALQDFANDFLPPLHGRYVADPAVMDEEGIVFLPPPVADALPIVAAGAGIAMGIAAAVFFAWRKRELGWRKRD